MSKNGTLKTRWSDSALAPLSILVLTVCGHLMASIHWDHPGIFTCVLRWAVAFSFLVAWSAATRSRRFALAMVPGITCNALVQLANGGYMPADIRFDSDGTLHGIYTPLSDDTALPFLADILPPFGASVGDCLLLAGLIYLGVTRLIQWRSELKGEE